MALVALLPWWAGALMALASYLLLHTLAEQAIQPATQSSQIGSMVTQTIGRTLAFYGQYLLPLLCLVGAAASAFKRHSRKQLLKRTTSNPAADAFNQMNWQQFERLVGEGFRRQGFQVKETGQAGPDGGVDLELRRGGELQLVQCKQWRAQRVGVDVVRELYGAMAARGAAGGFVVTSGHFTEDANHFATGRNVQLIDGAQLRALLASSDDPAGQPPAQTSSKSAPPDCPTCGKQMALRTAKRGPLAGCSFWGCTAYPRCHGTRDIHVS